MADEQTQYGIIWAIPVLPMRNLLPVPHKNAKLVVGYPAFGPGTYHSNLSEMQKEYFCSQEHPKIRFREPTTSESISVCAYEFEKRAKPEILDPRWLQLGRIVRASEGVFANPPKDSEGKPIVDEKILKSHLNGVEKINGIYLVDDKDNLRDFGFAPYESFQKEVQDCDTFANGGLARLLEHTREKIAKNLREIASPKLYKTGVIVWEFNPVNKLVLEVVAGLNSSRYIWGNRLVVDGSWSDSDTGYVFGVL